MEVVKDFCMNAASYRLGQMREKVKSLQEAVKQTELPSQAAVKNLVTKLCETLKYRCAGSCLSQHSNSLLCVLVTLDCSAEQWKSWKNCCLSMVR